ncbi:MAG: 2,3-bisphosphoglycerate-independent phosphoglycerate mutase [Geminicoccaceae bacterium]|nr:2,3-bisphosphoglycerate-independent phosphoglycerate mutase [Geminicoccaceae bacterium]
MGPVVLCILDGWGWRESRGDNAVALADTPVFDRLWRDCPHVFLRTDGPAVGLPEGQFGNSEVGHMNLGAGRVVVQDLPRINHLIETGGLFEGEAYKAFVARAKAGGGRVHLLGLISPGGVHGHQRQTAQLARALDGAGFEVLVHAFTDGRDTPPRAAIGYLDDLLDDLKGTRVRIATVSGRYYAMDRDKRWERTKLAFDAIVAGKGPRAETARAAVEAGYADDLGDEFVVPTVIGGYAGLKDGDAVLCTNFRADRVRQIMAALALPGFDGFERPPLHLSVLAGMKGYSENLDAELLALVPTQELDRILGEVVAEAGLRQLRMAETEKYPHVTFFFNGGEERLYPGEERIMEPSPKVATYDLQPEMSAMPLTDRLVAAVGAEDFGFVLVNFANPDMVGHTGVIPAAVQAIEAVDACLGRVVDTVLASGGACLITADHGNADNMLEPDGSPNTAHSLNPVPVIVTAEGFELAEGGILADVAPTILEMLGIAQPAEMTGHSLIEPA